MTGLDSHEQTSSNIDFDKMSGIGNIFKFMFMRSAASTDNSQEEFKQKSYSEILREYEKFFSLDEELL